MKTRLAMWIVAMTALGLFVGLLAPVPSGPAAASAPLADTTFITTLHIGDPDIGRYGSDSNLSKLAHAVCDALTNGRTGAEIIAREKQVNPGLPLFHFGWIAYAGILAYCTQHSNLIHSR